MKLQLPSLRSSFSKLSEVFPESLSCSPLNLVGNPLYFIGLFHTIPLLQLLRSEHLKFTKVQRRKMKANENVTRGDEVWYEN